MRYVSIIYRAFVSLLDAAIIEYQSDEWYTIIT